MAIISIRNLKKTLGGNNVLKGVNLDVEKGEIMALVGPSGSGKSTLLRCLNRLIEADEGEVIFDDRNIKSLSPVDLRRSMVLVHQEVAMFAGSVYDNVAHGPSLMGNVDRGHIERCMVEAGLGLDFTRRDAAKLSGGEKKRVALARALALEPRVMLLDEPTAGVDPKKVEQVEKTIVNFSRELGLTVLWVTHHVEQAKRVSDRIANLKDGVVKEVQRTEDFKWEGAY